MDRQITFPLVNIDFLFLGPLYLHSFVSPRDIFINPERKKKKKGNIWQMSRQMLIILANPVASFPGDHLIRMSSGFLGYSGERTVMEPLFSPLDPKKISAPYFDKFPL